jgi:hypothetical protein
MLNTEVSNIAASISSVQTKELENGNHQISRGKFDPVQYCAYFGERKYFESTQRQPYDNSYCDAKLPSHRKISSKTNLIASHRIFMLQPRNNGRHLIALSELSDQLDTTGYHTRSLMKAIGLSGEVVLRIFKGVNAF